MRSSRALALVVILAAFGCGPSATSRELTQHLALIEQLTLNGKLAADVGKEQSALLVSISQRLDALATPPTILKAPEGAFWLGPRECPVDAPCAITLFFGQGKPADLQLVPYVPQGAPAVPVARPPAK